MQGTTGFGDILTDIDLTASGAAKAQIVDMVNWWLKNTTPIGQDAKQIALFHDTFLLTTSIAGTGLLSDVTHLSVNGHSLGGHLATAFARLFGGQWSIGHTDTYNSAGFTLNSGTVFDRIASLLGPNVGMGRFPNEDEQSNFFAENGINVTTRTLFNGQEGHRIPLFNEESTGIPNHYMYKLTDALALGDVLARIDNTIDITRMNTLFESGSNKADASLESILDTLVHLFIGNSISDTPIGDEGDSPNSRVIYHFNLAALKDELFDDSTVLNPQLKPNYQNLRIIDVASLAGSASLDTAEGLAYRYALQALNPFAVVGTDYNAHNNGALDLYNPTTGQGEITEQWLTDRAQLLSHLLQRNHDDTLFASDINAEQIFEDYALPGVFDGTHLILTGPETLGEHSRQIIFGDDNAQQITGGNKNDHLYGGDGDDLLTGSQGNDYLEGGQGSDIYAFMAGDGLDTLLDTDGLGKITLDGIQIKGQTGVAAEQWLQAGNTWQDRQHRIGYNLVTQADGTQDLLIATADNTLIVKNWHTDELGITLGNATPVEPAIDLTVTGDFNPLDQDPNTAGMQISYDALGNLITDTEQPDPGRRDTLYDSTGNDSLKGFAGNDSLDARRGGNDVLEGGAGSDILNGGAGNDLLYAEAEISLADALAQANTQAASGLRGDWLYGGEDSDTLVGEGGNDLLLGGSGTDLLIGGGGDDNLFGDLTGSASPDWEVSRSITTRNNVTIYTLTYAQATTDSNPVGGADNLYGGAGNDWLFGNRGNDLLDGGIGNDVLFGGEHSDILLGGADDDILAGDRNGTDEGEDYLDGGDASDTLFGGGKNDTLHGGADADELSKVARMKCNGIQENQSLDCPDSASSIQATRSIARGSIATPRNSVVKSGAERHFRRGLSRMKGNFHVRFLGEKKAVMPFSYPTIRSNTAT